MTLPDFLTDEQIADCFGLWPNRTAIRNKIILPNMGEIVSKIGQACDADFLSYIVCYVINVARKN